MQQQEEFIYSSPLQPQKPPKKSYLQYIKTIIIILILFLFFISQQQHKQQISQVYQIIGLLRDQVKSVKIWQDKYYEKISSFRQIDKENFRQTQMSIKSDVDKLTHRLLKTQKKFNQLELNIEEKIIEISKSKKSLSTESSSAIKLPSKALQSLQIKNQLTYLNLKQTYHLNKIEYIKKLIQTQIALKPQKISTQFHLAIRNINLQSDNVFLKKEINQKLAKEKNRFEKEYQISNYQQLTRFCVVVPTLNNAFNFRYEYNIQSILNQQYSNFHVVIIDDASKDNTYELIQQYLQQNNIPQSKVTLIQNIKRKTALPNIHRAITSHCSATDIVMLVDGDDQLLGRQAFKVFNAVYQQSKADVVYSNHLKLYWKENHVYTGWSLDYTPQQKKKNRYRDVPQKISHLRSFKAQLYLKIKEEDLKDSEGQFFTSTYDEVICLPILQMSCGKIKYIEEYFYLYNFQIGTNDISVDSYLQKSVANEVKRNRKRYQCLKQE